MTGIHGCGGWKRAKKSKGYYRRLQTDTGKWYTITTTRTFPERRRGISKTWTGAEQRGMNVYLSGGAYGGVWFEYKGTGHGTGDDSYKVHGLDGTTQTREMLEYFGVPYNKVWTEQTGVYGIKVPGGALLNSGWPWSTKLGYPTKYSTIYWIWEEGGPKTKTTENIWLTWYEYLDVIKALNHEELELFKKKTQENILEDENIINVIDEALIRTGAHDAYTYRKKIESYFESLGWTLENVQNAQKIILDSLWEQFWLSVTARPTTFNFIWWFQHEYYNQETSDHFKNVKAPEFQQEWLEKEGIDIEFFEWAITGTWGI